MIVRGEFDEKRDLQGKLRRARPYSEIFVWGKKEMKMKTNARNKNKTIRSSMRFSQGRFCSAGMSQNKLLYQDRRQNTIYFFTRALRS